MKIYLRNYGLYNQTQRSLLKIMKLLRDLILQLKSKNSFKKNLKPPKNWKKDLISLYIVRNSDGICLFSHHFQLGLMSQIENQLIGMGFTAISKMMQEVVDTSSRLIMMDLGPKKVLIEERGNKLAILVVIKDSPFYRKKLEELIDYFEKIFELQEQIDQTTHVCVEDYALTDKLVSLVFSDQSVNIIELIPLVFKAIQKNKPKSFMPEYLSFQLNTNKNSQYDKKLKGKEKIEVVNKISR